MQCPNHQMGPIRKQKRIRSAFTTEQISFLEQQYKKFPYIATEYRKVVAKALNIQDRAVKIWFQNRRMREKKELKGECDKISETRHINNVRNLTGNNQPYTFKVPSNTVDASTKVNFNNGTTHTAKPQTNSYQHSSIEHMKVKPQIHQNAATTNTVLNLKKLSHIPMEHCKKNKFPKTIIENQKKKVPQSMQRINQCLKNTKISSNVESRAKKTLGTVRNLKVKPTYLPVMRAVYGHPVLSPSQNLIWKPMNVIPFASPGTFHSYNSVQGTCHVQNTNKCHCNCHTGPTPVFNPGVNINNNPYHQYVISMPYHNPNH